MKITLEQLKEIVRNLKAVDLQFGLAKPEEEAQWYINLLEPSLNILMVAYFGEANAQRIWDFVLDDSPFKTVEELYEFLSDSYSHLVNTDSALSLSQLLELFPDEPMFKDFKYLTDKLN